LSWPVVSVKDICELKYGKALKASARSDAGYPVVGAGGVVGAHAEALIGGPSIVVGRKGSIGSLTYLVEPSWPIDTTYYVTESGTEADLRWLYWALQSLGLNGMNKSAAVPGLNREDVYRLALALPPLPEQRRIASILDRVQEMQTQRDETIRQLDSLPGHIYMQRFGARLDPISPLEDWLAQGKNSMRTGPFGSQMLVEEFVDSGVAVLGIDNVRNNSFQSGANRHITLEKYKELARYKVYADDVLITIMGTVGRACVVPAAIPLSITSKHLCALTLDRDRLLPGYLQAYILNHPIARKHLGESQKGAIMAGLNMSILRRLPVLVPSMREQQRFIADIADVSATRVSALTHQSALSELAMSLQHRAFKGEL